ncbi:bifunctional riboflavin kinase/FAD synthetase [Perlucidibaca aquatica]|uniref:bifunctional riboflavin kinase/FAD synthetase n=1 Tax=Perlucidibaca aquatica TaxID=1852776 RepID=UPI00083A7A9F|nr:bifunctional riboflavin kinase/FAD synthetase [Perlucidibaca aquatica]
MQLIRGLHNLRPEHRGNAVTIGNFDGVHHGHQAMVAALKQRADALGVPALVMCFEPQPQEFFAESAGRDAPARLMTWRDKVEALAEAGADRVLLVRFNARFRAYTANGFIDELLVSALGARHVLVGDDFRFGCDRSGDHALLTARGQLQGFSVGQMPTVTVADERVSSTRLRAAVAAADFALAEALTGRPFAVAGHVVHGDKLGRTLGLPTANLLMHRQVLPLRGVFAVEVFGADAAAPEKAYPGVANVGSRPTVQGVQARCESFLLNFNGDLYGRRLRVVFRHKLRDEQRFPSLDALKTAIEADVAAGHDYFAV